MTPCLRLRFSPLALTLLGALTMAQSLSAETARPPEGATAVVARYKEACDGGDARSCADLGSSYAKGYGGLPKDPTRAVALYKQACDGGNALGCRDLASSYANGDGGLPEDPARAAALFKQACDGGDAGGCNNFVAANASGKDGLPIANNPTRSATARDAPVVVVDRNLLADPQVHGESGEEIRHDTDRPLSLYLKGNEAMLKMVEKYLAEQATPQ